MKFWQKSLMARLVSYFLLLSLAIGGLSVFVAYIQGQNALEKSVHDRLTAAATLQENELNRWLEDQRQVVLAIAQLPQIQAQAALLLNHANTGTEVDSSVFAVAFSPDGQWLATGGIDQTVRLWDVATGQEVNRLIHPDAVGGVSFSPDGQLLATIGGDLVVRMWETASGREVAQMVHQDDLNDLDFSPDGQWLATATPGGEVVIWETATGRQVLTVSEDLEYVNDLEFSPDGQWLATASDDGLGRLWNPATGQEVISLEHDGWVTVITFSPDSELVTTVSEDNAVRIWEAATGRLLAELPHDGWASDAVFSPDGQRLATASADRMVRVWDVATGQEIIRLEHDKPVPVVLFSPTGRQLLAFETDTSWANLWDLNTQSLIAELSHDAILDDFDFSPDGEYVATASYDGTARLWDTATGEELLQLAHDSLPYTLLKKSLSALTNSTADLQTISILAQNGRIIVSTDAAYEGRDQHETEYFSKGQLRTFVQTVHLSPLSGEPTITIATPFRNKSGQVNGLLAADLNLARMDAIVAERTGLGETGVTYLVNNAHQQVTANGFSQPAIHSQGIDAAVQGQDGAGDYQNYKSTPVVGVYRWLDNFELALLAEMDQQEASASARRLAGVVSLTGLVAAAVLVVGVYVLARQIARPILAIAAAAAAVEAETFETEGLAEVARRPDEVGLLARVFQSMARKVYSREQRLKKQVQELRIEIDDLRRKEEVEKIVDTDFFRDLQSKARHMRRRQRGEAPAGQVEDPAANPPDENTAS
ncbi:MAG: HAMP domain-containing protein [Anaerolineae bacterium]|nr:HAMP domain-containing protein [Anaerolineae bacterium]